jgi:hypothetical protein
MKTFITIKFRLISRVCQPGHLDTWTQKNYSKMQQKCSLISLFLTLQLDDARVAKHNHFRANVKVVYFDLLFNRKDGKTETTKDI